jgi:two-component system invasion response regulator UvrY
MATIGLVEDHIILRQGLSALLNALGHRLLFEADNGLDCMDKLNQLSILPDIIIMDITMPEMDGFEATALIREYYPNIRVLALSMIDDEIAVIRMVRNGARGYILKNCKLQELNDAIHSLTTHGYYHSDLLSSRLIHAINHYDDKNDVKNVLSLSERELMFLKLASTEMTYKEIADVMHISPRTVDNYRENLFQKLSLKSRVGLVIYAVRTKIVNIS